MAIQKTSLGPIEVDDTKAYQRRGVIGGLIDGLSSLDVTETMRCSKNNIDKHIARLYDDLGASNGPAALAVLFRNGLIRFLCLCCFVHAAFPNDSVLAPRRTSRVSRTRQQSAKNPNYTGDLALIWDSETGLLLLESTT